MRFVASWRHQKIRERERESSKKVIFSFLTGQRKKVKKKVTKVGSWGTIWEIEVGEAVSFLLKREFIKKKN